MDLVGNMSVDGTLPWMNSIDSWQFSYARMAAVCSTNGVRAALASIKECTTFNDREQSTTSSLGHGTSAMYAVAVCSGRNERQCRGKKAQLQRAPIDFILEQC